MTGKGYQSMVTERRTHGGPLHAVRSKRELAEHIGEAHLLDGRVHRVVSPPFSGRVRWARAELENTHAAMHDPKVYDAEVAS